MASRGVNLTGLSLAQPSVFEISSQESLASVLEPAVKRVLDVSFKLIRFVLANLF